MIMIQAPWVGRTPEEYAEIAGYAMDDKDDYADEIDDDAGEDC